MKNNIFKFILILIFAIYIFANISFAQSQQLDLNSLQEIITLINENYKEKVSNDKLIENAARGMLNSLDAYSLYLTKEQYNKLMENLNGEFVGIGVHIKKAERYIEITEVIDNSPAKKSGLKVGDKFFSVDGVSAIDVELDILVSKIKGEKGTKVKVGILRNGSSDPIYFEIERNNIVNDVVLYEVLDENIGYIKILEFNKNTKDMVDKALEEFNIKGVNKLIIDLRGNPGGYLDSVIEVAKNFIPKGPIVHIKQQNGEFQTVNSDLEKVKYKLAVLVDGSSASASEIFAGAVQDTKVGTIIGTKTYGKGTVQTFFKLKNEDYIKLTIADYMTPNKRRVEETGIVPDVIISDVKSINCDNFEQVKHIRNISPGNRGKDVFAIEQRLEALGYKVDGPDYIYDNITRQSIIQFKKDYNIFPNSIITRHFERVIEKGLLEHASKDLQLEKAIEILN